MRGDALSWFKWMYQNHQFTDWISFIRVLELRFGTSTYANHQAELFKLRQNGTVAEYQKVFEKLCNRVLGLTPEMILDCFISDLIPDIRREMTVLQPNSITQVMGLAKLLESKFQDSKRVIRQVPFLPQHSPHLLPPSRPSFPPQPPSSTPPQLPIKKLTFAQLQEHRAAGLCYNCDAKKIPGHKCNFSRLLLLLSEDLTPEHPTNTSTHIFSNPQSPTFSDPELDFSNPETYDTTHINLSFQALSGTPSSNTFKLEGLLGHLSITILIDTGSSHNILQLRLANHLQLCTIPVTPFSVMVGNREQIHCSSLCPNVSVFIQHHNFSIPFYLIPIEGADMVLGMD